MYMWKYMDSGSAKKPGVLTWAVITFSSGAENQICLQRLVKKGQVRNSVWKWELCMDHYDVAAFFTLPNNRWNGMYEYAELRTQHFEFPTCNCVSHLQASHFLSIIRNTWTWSLHDPKLAHQNKLSEVHCKVDYYFNKWL